MNNLHRPHRPRGHTRLSRLVGVELAEAFAEALLFTGLEESTERIAVLPGIGDGLDTLLFGR